MRACKIANKPSRKSNKRKGARRQLKPKSGNKHSVAKWAGILFGTHFGALKISLFGKHATEGVFLLRYCV